MHIIGGQNHNRLTIKLGTSGDAGLVPGWYTDCGRTTGAGTGLVQGWYVDCGKITGLVPGWYVDCGGTTGNGADGDCPFCLEESDGGTAGMKNGPSTTVVIRQSFAVLPPFLLVVDFFQLFFPIPLLLSHATTIALTFMLAGPFSCNHFTYLARVLVFSATATVCEQVFVFCICI